MTKQSITLLWISVGDSHPDSIGSSSDLIRSSQQGKPAADRAENAIGTCRG